MNKTKLKIIEMLGDLVDTELKFGCIIKTYGEDHNGLDGNEYMVYVNSDEFEGAEFLRKDYSGTRNFKNELDMPFANMGDHDFDYEIIGQYHLGIILNWIWEVETEWDSIDILSFGGKLEIIFESSDKEDSFEIKLDLSKPPMERSEEEDKNLLAFMKEIKGKTN